MSDIDMALDALRDYEQTDEDGVMVLASRQAIEEVHAAFIELQDIAGKAQATADEAVRLLDNLMRRLDAHFGGPTCVQDWKEEVAARAFLAAQETPDV